MASVAIFTSSSDYKIDTLASFVDGGSLGSYRTAYFGDFSGDCVSDLILLVDNGLISQLQFIRGKPNGLFAMVGTATLGVSVQHFTLNDISIKSTMQTSTDTTI